MPDDRTAQLERVTMKKNQVVYDCGCPFLKTAGCVCTGGRTGVECDPSCTRCARRDDLLGTLAHDIGRIEVDDLPSAVDQWDAVLLMLERRGMTICKSLKRRNK